jgi:predicted nucleic acid-binding protein
MLAFRPKFSHTILPFDAAAADALTMLTLRAKAKKYTLPVADSFVAAIASADGYTVATRDVEPFQAAGVPVINPWKG